MHYPKMKYLLMIMGLFFIVAFAGSTKSSFDRSKKSLTYYINSETGDDTNKGTSAKRPFKTLAKMSSIRLKSGDKILLAARQTFYGSLVLNDVHGDSDNPIIVSAYGLSDNVLKDRPIIDAKGLLNGVKLENCSYIELENLVITANGGNIKTEKWKKKAMRCGILVKISKKDEYRHIYLRNLLVKDVFYENAGVKRPKGEIKTANGTQNYGWGIRFINNTENALLSDVQIRSCVVENVGHTGIKLTARSQKGDYNIRDVKIYDNKIFEVGGPGIQMSGIKNGHISNNNVNGSGSNNDSRKWGRGSGLWTWSATDIVIEKNQFLNANGPGDSAGCHIDFNCKNIVVQYNLSANNAGGFCEILGNNFNCAYRYNVSVNDGHRVKGKNGAFQEGKIFWLSGYRGHKKKREGPFNSYFYNNTIFVKNDIVAKIAIDKAASGALIVNNVFCIEGKSKTVLGDQYNPEKAGVVKVENFVFENNLYLQETNWPKNTIVQDGNPVFGNPMFANKGGLALSDYIPANVNLMKDKGLEIVKIPNDTIGLTIGLKVEYDILGNRITGLPDMGAIEIK